MRTFTYILELETQLKKANELLQRWQNTTVDPLNDEEASALWQTTEDYLQQVNKKT
jgi:chemotaxis regulatin CheY-phosphate phosphatase CheZ